MPTSIEELYKARMKYLSKNTDISFIFAYAGLLGSRLDRNTLEKLGVKNFDENIKSLIEAKLIHQEEEIIYNTAQRDKRAFGYRPE